MDTSPLVPCKHSMCEARKENAHEKTHKIDFRLVVSVEGNFACVLPYRLFLRLSVRSGEYVKERVGLWIYVSSAKRTVILSGQMEVAMCFWFRS
jgi:hypothetical protein